MSNRTNTNGYTITFAIIMVVIVGGLLSFFAELTKDARKKNDEIKAQIDVLASLKLGEEQGVNRSSAEVKFKEFIKEQLVVEGDKASPDDKAYLIDLKKEQNKAKKGEVPRLPLFIAEIGGSKKYILPVRGNGLWDAIWGYIALNEDMKTIYGVYFDHKAETPGLGANIVEGYFRDDFQGEHIYDEKGVFKGVEVSKSNNDPNNERKEDNAVDALSGATITGNGVADMIRKGINSYLPYLNTLKQ